MRLETSIDFDLNWFTIEIDKSRLMQITNNFVSNSLKFTPREGLIKISCSLKSEQSGEGSLYLTVSDTGIGISSRDQKKLFERYSIVEGS